MNSLELSNRTIIESVDYPTFFRKLPTYPSPKPAFCPKWEVSVNVGLEEGKVGSFPAKNVGVGGYW